MFCISLLLVDFTHILQGYFNITGAIIWLPQCHWSNLEKYRWMIQIYPLRTITKTKQSTAKTMRVFYGMYQCIFYGMYSVCQLITKQLETAYILHTLISHHRLHRTRLTKNRHIFVKEYGLTTLIAAVIFCSPMYWISIELFIWFTLCCIWLCLRFGTDKFYYTHTISMSYSG